MVSRLIYFVREALRGFVQAKLMTFVSIVTIAVSLLLLGVAGVGVYNVQVLFRQASRNVDIVAYLTDACAADSTQVTRIRQQLASRPEYASVNYVDKAGAWNRFSALYGKEMLQAVDRNPLPASFEISLAARFQTESVARRLVAEIQSVRGVENVEYSREWLATLERARAYVLGGAVVLGIICILVLYFVVSNTVKLTIYARKDVVTTMRFVGATDAYIATPFVLEGILQGAVGATISAGALWLLQMLAGPMLAAKVPVVVFPILIAMGVAFGWLGSTSAIRRFLD